MDEPNTLKNPFVGLRAFEENEDDIFFGRDKEIGDLISKFSKTTFLAVVGSSGSGKSSLVKSGLLPAIHSGFLVPGCNWHVAIFRPADDPIGEMTRALAAEGVLYKNVSEQITPPQAIIDSTLRRSSLGLIQAYNQAFNQTELKKTEKLLIVVDQFEELFRYKKYEKPLKEGGSDSKHFIELLLTAANQPEQQVYILITMRSDFIGDCAAFTGLPEAINEGQYLVPRMTRDEIREAIIGPIAVGEAGITPRLVTRILNEIDNDIDQLPIMQHAMMRTWDFWQKKNLPDSPIDFDDYENSGRMVGALNKHAEEAYEELLNADQKKICELMFKALTDRAADVRGIRRPKSVADLSLLTNSNAKSVIEVVEVFRQVGRTFLMPPPEKGALNEKSIIDISHESLMRVWKRLVEWTEEEASNGEIYLRLVNSAELNNKGEKELLEKKELAIALEWMKSANPTEKWAAGYKGDFNKAMDYLEKSQQKDLADKEAARRREKNKKNSMIAFIIFLIVVAFVMLVFWQNAKRANEQAEMQKKEAQKNLLEVYKSDSIRYFNERKIHDSNLTSFKVYLKAGADVQQVEKDTIKSYDDKLFSKRRAIDSLKKVLAKKN